MKKKISNLFILAAAIFMMTSCDDKYPVMFDESNIIVGMSTAAVSVNENNPGSFTVYLGGVSETQATDVTLTVSVVDIASPAVEGQDYTLSTKNVNVPVGVTAVTVTPVDNDVYTGNKQFMVSIASNSKNYPMAVQQSTLVTIVDDEHPLKNWIGTYTVEAVSYGSPGSWDETWNVTTTAVASDPTQLSITGISGAGSGPVIATFNTTDMTIELESVQNLGLAYGTDNGNVAIYYATDEVLALAGDALTTAIIANAGKQKIVGTIEADGTIKIDRFALILTEYAWCWDAFNTTWTKN